MPEFYTCLHRHSPLSSRRTDERETFDCVVKVSYIVSATLCYGLWRCILYVTNSETAFLAPTGLLILLPVFITYLLIAFLFNLFAARRSGRCGLQCGRSIQVHYFLRHYRQRSRAGFPDHRGFASIIIFHVNIVVRSSRVCGSPQGNTSATKGHKMFDYHGFSLRSRARFTPLEIRPTWLNACG
jgi:hypothetical protein